MRRPFATLAVSCTLALAALPALAQELKVAAADGVQEVLRAQKDKRVTLRLASGQELTGVVRDVTPKLVVIGAPQGREFFDAAIPMEKVEAVLVRTKPQ